jgi:CYTH domain-containing protein
VNTGHGQHELKETRYELTQKRSLTPGDKTRREETTVELSEEEYEALRPKAIRSLKKNRHLIPLERGLTAELDVFQDGLKGLVWVEVEFPTEESMAAFEPPDWFGREVSNEKWASSSWVAGRTFEEIKQFVV